MLKDVLTYGTASALKKFAGERPAAGKTGTTDDYRDAWFIGYTPQLITGVWVGHDTPQPGGKGFTGGAVAAPIWERFMRKALAKQPAVDFPEPETVVTVSHRPANRISGYGGVPGTAGRTLCCRHGANAVLLRPRQAPRRTAGREPAGGASRE